MKSFFHRALKLLPVLSFALLLCVACKDKNETSTPQPVISAEPSPVEIKPTNNQVVVEEPKVVLPPGVLSPEEARNHVGEIATVRGKVYRVYASQKGDVFIDIGGRHPNAPFTAVCFQQKIPTAFLQELNDQIISVRGKITEYQGKVEIVLENEKQISR